MVEGVVVKAEAGESWDVRWFVGRGWEAWFLELMREVSGANAKMVESLDAARRRVRYLDPV